MWDRVLHFGPWNRLARKCTLHCPVVVFSSFSQTLFFSRISTEWHLQSPWSFLKDAYCFKAVRLTFQYCSFRYNLAQAWKMRTGSIRLNVVVTWPVNIDVSTYGQLFWASSFSIVLLFHYYESRFFEFWTQRAVNEVNLWRLNYG